MTVGQGPTSVGQGPTSAGGAPAPDPARGAESWGSRHPAASWPAGSGADIPAGHPRFFSLEGVDGSGKTTQLSLLDAALKKRGFETLCVREPGGTPVSDRIRAILLSPDHPVSPEAELLLFSAARAQLVSEVIAPALRAGKVVLADRFGWSTLAYQGYGRGLDQDRIRFLLRLACGDVWPGHSWLLDLPAGLMRRRLEAAGRGPDRMEGEKAEFFEKVRRGYREIAEGNAGHFTVLDATGTPESLHEALYGQVLARLR